MNKLTPSITTTYEQTQQEFLVGSSYCQEQIEFIRNQIAASATLKLNLVPDPNNYPAFIQQEAYFKGQMDAYQYLIDCHNAAQESLVALASAPQQ